MADRMTVPWSFTSNLSTVVFFFYWWSFSCLKNGQKIIREDFFYLFIYLYSLRDVTTTSCRLAANVLPVSDILQDFSDWPNTSCETQRHDGKWEYCAWSMGPYCTDKATPLKWVGSHIGLLEGGGVDWGWFQYRQSSTQSHKTPPAALFTQSEQPCWPTWAKHQPAASAYTATQPLMTPKQGEITNSWWKTHWWNTHLCCCPHCHQSAAGFRFINTLLTSTCSSLKGGQGCMRDLWWGREKKKKEKVCAIKPRRTSLWYCRWSLAILRFLKQAGLKIVTFERRVDLPSCLVNKSRDTSAHTHVHIYRVRPTWKLSGGWKKLRNRRPEELGVRRVWLTLVGKTFRPLPVSYHQAGFYTVLCGCRHNVKKPNKFANSDILRFLKCTKIST